MKKNDNNLFNNLFEKKDFSKSLIKVKYDDKDFSNLYNISNEENIIYNKLIKKR